jgi:hypothetical protein
LAISFEVSIIPDILSFGDSTTTQFDKEELEKLLPIPYIGDPPGIIYLKLSK